MTALGKPLDRVDGLLKVTGQARYAGEFPEDGLLHGSVVSSTIAKGRVLAIDASRALALPGVVAVIHHLNRPKIASYDDAFQDDDAADGSPFRPLYNDRVLYSGQPLALVIADNRRLEVVERVRLACNEGRQAYWVCTLIEESEELTCQAAETTFEDLSAALGGLNVGLIHGRMKPAEKAAVMDQFKQGRLQLLVATTVIEVGVDVPNASLMIIENPERLGLAQLHQLRGRVGRGSAASHCLLLYHPPLSQLGRERLAIMRETCDGFVIAEKDLELRGPGEMLGTRQTGLLQFKVADLMRDADLLPAVRDAAQTLLEHWPQHVSPLLERWLRHGQQYGQV